MLKTMWKALTGKAKGNVVIPPMPTYAPTCHRWYGQPYMSTYVKGGTGMWVTTPLDKI